MGLPKVSSLYSLQQNVEEYQRCAAQLNGGISSRQEPTVGSPDDYYPICLGPAVLGKICSYPWCRA